MRTAVIIVVLLLLFIALLPLIMQMGRGLKKYVSSAVAEPEETTPETEVDESVRDSAFKEYIDRKKK